MSHFYVPPPQLAASHLCMCRLYLDKTRENHPSFVCMRVCVCGEGGRQIC